MADPRSFPLWAQASLLLPAGIGGVLASFLGVPLPYLIGGLAVAAGLTIWLTLQGYAVDFPKPLRRICVGIIGTMIGGTFAPEMMSILPSLWISLLAMIVFVAMAYSLSFWVYTRLGGYDRTTAAFAAMPGGLIEAVSMGVEAGADARLLSVQHFARIVLVVTLVPMGFWLVSGEAVGSSAGEGFSRDVADVSDVLVICAISALGMWIAPKLRMPASHLMGPMLLSACVHGSGLWATASPMWLLNAAQLVVGTGLGAMFGGATLAMLARAFGYGALVVVLMLGLALIFATGLASALPLPIDALLISFAPGGVTEMGLIALSLGASPVFVAIHHLFRIGLTAILSSYILRREQRAKP